MTKLAVYEGLSTLNIKDKHNLTGPILRQIDDVLNYMKLINIKPTSTIINDKINRQEIVLYPKEAIREAVINAFTFRDYSIPADIRIEFYDNRLEIHSLDSIYGGNSVEDIKASIKNRKNSIIYSVLDKIGYIGNVNSGIKQIYRSYSDFHKNPEITITSNVFKVTFFNRNLVPN
jgi:predicted HTH transcriptional regulator